MIVVGLYLICYLFLGIASNIITGLYIDANRLTTVHNAGIIACGPTFGLAAIGGYCVAKYRERRNLL